MGTRGGRRAGAGRPRKSALEHFVTGDAGKRGRVLTLPGAEIPAPPGPVAVDEFDAPNDLSTEERNVWLRLAPFAFKNGTLTKASSYAFVLLCKFIVLERNEAKSSGVGGSNHRGLIQRVEGGLDAFQLRPQGRPMPPIEGAEKPVNKLDRFLKTGA